MELSHLNHKIQTGGYRLTQPSVRSFVLLSADVEHHSEHSKEHQTNKNGPRLMSMIIILSTKDKTPLISVTSWDST